MNVNHPGIPDIKAILAALPDGPGVYQYFDETGKILYVGKARSLKKRVSSYFHKEHENGKLRVLVRKICDIQYIVVDTEFDALLLENNLIKQLQPRYNILLKDDKTYPWLCISNEVFPRIFATRQKILDGSIYFGPYASSKVMHAILDVIKSLFQLRTCKLNLSSKNVSAGKYNVCLEHHIGNCAAPCVGKISEDEYSVMIRSAQEIIKGNISGIIKEVKKEMLFFSNKLEFEKAQQLKVKLQQLERFQSRSTVISSMKGDADVFSIVADDSMAYVNCLRVVKGAIIQGHTMEIKKRLDESNEDLLSFALADFKQQYDRFAEELILPFPISAVEGIAKITIPQKGAKLELLTLSLRNARQAMTDRVKKQELADPERHVRRILQTMMKDLRLQNEPRHIECFDNSNFHGENAVSSCVVFKDARPSKRDYRHFNIKTVVGPDDFASMKEVVGRRYKRLLEENSDLPDLIIVDGGKGQLSATVEALDEMNLRGKIAVIGIAKRLEEIYFPEDSVPLYIDKKSESLRLIQRMRDEAHRFGISHHRSKRDKGLLISEIKSISGIGDVLGDKLLAHFGSVKNISDAPLQLIEELIGKSKALLVYNYFHNS